MNTDPIRGQIQRTRDDCEMGYDQIKALQTKSKSVSHSYYAINETSYEALPNPNSSGAERDQIEYHD